MFLRKSTKLVASPGAIRYITELVAVLSQGVSRTAGAVIGVSRITAWLTQASDKTLPDRFAAVSVTT